MKVTIGAEGEEVLYPFFNLGGGWATQRSGCVTPGKRPGTHSIGGWADPHGRSGRVRKISLLPVFDPWKVEPVASRYADWAIPAQLTL